MVALMIYEAARSFAIDGLVTRSMILLSLAASTLPVTSAKSLSGIIIMIVAMFTRLPT